MVKLRKKGASKNEVELNLIKVEGNSVFDGKGKWNTETTLLTEKTGKIRKHFSRYHINPLHIKRYPYGTGLIFIDLATHKSFNPHSEKKDVQTINQIQYITQAANWEAHQNKMKMNKWQILLTMLSGMGIAFILLTILGVFR